jgi:hypothetical protein
MGADNEPQASQGENLVEKCSSGDQFMGWLRVNLYVNAKYPEK